MSRLSHWMIGLGGLLIATESIGMAWSFPIGLQYWFPLSGIPTGLLMIAAGVAAAQGRRSVRLTGVFVGIFIPLAMGIFFLWDAFQAWNNSATLSCILLTMSAILSLCFVAQFYRLRPHEGVETRGYAVTLPHHESPQPQVMTEPAPQSKAG